MEKGSGIERDGLAERYGARLLRAALLFSRDPAEARDLVQETFCAVLEGKAPFRGEAAPYSWLYGILRRRYLMRRRQLGRVWSGPVLAEPAAEWPEPELRLDLERGAGRLAAAMARLSFKLREALLLRYVEEMKIAEMARLLGISTGTVKSRLHHATRRLQRLLPADANPFAAGQGGLK